MKKNGKPWICPSWVTGNTATHAPRPRQHRKPPARPPTCRRSREAPDDLPACAGGDRAGCLRTAHLYPGLSRREDEERRAALPTAHYSVLFEGTERDGRSGEIVTAQIGGNGSPYAILMRHFGGAINSEKRVETAPEPPANGGADPIADERIVTPQSAKTPLQCIEDHQNSSAPADVPGGASYVPGADWTNGGRLDLSGWRDPSVIHVPSEWVDRRPPHVLCAGSRAKRGSGR